MPESKRTDRGSMTVQIEITRCPECGTELERVETHRCEPRALDKPTDHGDHPSPLT